MFEHGVLNTDAVQELIDSKGLKRIWVINQMGLKRTAGMLMLRDGLLPKDDALREAALAKLSQILGVEVPQILLRLKRPRSA